MNNGNTVRTAIVTDVPLGSSSITIEGLQFTDTDNIEFGVGIPQISDLFLDTRNYAAQGLKRLMGKDFKTHKCKTEFNPKPINVIALTQFEQVTFELAISGNVKAQSFVRTLYGLALHQLFCDAFKLKFEKEDRQNWLTTRRGTKVTFRTMTDRLQEFGFKNGDDYRKFVWILQTKLGIPSGTRDIQDTETLQKLLIAQTQIDTCMELGLTPGQALSKVKV